MFSWIKPAAPPPAEAKASAKANANAPVKFSHTEAPDPQAQTDPGNTQSRRSGKGGASARAKAGQGANAGDTANANVSANASANTKPGAPAQKPARKAHMPLKRTGRQGDTRAPGGNFENTKARSGAYRNSIQPLGSPEHHGPHDLAWADLLVKVGEDVGNTLASALVQLRQIAQQYPQAAQALSTVQTAMEHAKRAATIAQQFAHLRAGRPKAAPENLPLRELVQHVVNQRGDWLARRQVNARLGLMGANVRGNATDLYSLIDELLVWAASIAPEVYFAMDETTAPPTSQFGSLTHPQPALQTRLQVSARVNPGLLDPHLWENVGWFLWHQLARSLGAQAELLVSDDALHVSVVFASQPEALSEAAAALLAGSGASSASASASAPPPASGFGAAGDADRVLDSDIASIIAGCRVVVVVPEVGLRDSAMLALSGLRLDLRCTWSVPSALEALGVGAPHAVVYDSALSPAEVRQMRLLLSERGRVAYVELDNTNRTDFHVSSSGKLSTAHVSVHAIAEALAPALVFELCKVI